MLLASTGTCSAETADEAEAALAKAEVAVAKARVREALWSTAWNALLEARRARIAKDYAASVRWSTRAAELAGLGLAHVATSRGRAAEALEHIDRATALAVSGAIGTLATGMVLCGTIWAYRCRGEWGRASVE